MKKLILLLAAGLFLASCGSNCMGKGVNFADADDNVKENYIMTADADDCVEVY
jgi:ABC-type glycerol-3-phosphate transport system substrate-binding protein